MFATTVLFSHVILYYYPAALNMNEIAIITQACEFLGNWEREEGNNVFMKNQFKNGKKPLLIFLRQNLPSDDQIEPVAKD